MYWFTLYRKC